MNKSTPIHLCWLLLVIIWNYKYPSVPPLYDVIAAVVLSALSILLKNIFFKGL